MDLVGVSLTETNETAESVVQNQTARMCSLILLYTFRKINAWWRTAGKRLKNVIIEIKFCKIYVCTYRGLLTS